MSAPAGYDDDEFFVLKDGRRLGPYSRDELLDRVDRGEIDYEDLCLRDFSSECERVREALDWDIDEGDELSVSNKVPASEEAPVDENEGDTDDEDFEDEEEEDYDLFSPPRDPSLILYAGHASLISFPKSLSILFASLGLGLWFRDVSGWILLSGMILALIAVSHIILERSTRLYLITPRRVEVVKGLFAKSSNEVRIDDIRTINVVRRGLAGMLGVGRVEFASSGGEDVEVAFDDVWAAQRVKGLVRRIQDAS